MTVILTIVDWFLKFVHFVALLKLQSSKETEKLIFLHVFHLHSLPVLQPVLDGILLADYSQGPIILQVSTPWPNRAYESRVGEESAMPGGEVPEMKRFADGPLPGIMYV